MGVKRPIQRVWATTTAPTPDPFAQAAQDLQREFSDRTKNARTPAKAAAPITPLYGASPMAGLGQAPANLNAQYMAQIQPAQNTALQQQLLGSKGLNQAIPQGYQASASVQLGNVAVKIVPHGTIMLTTGGGGGGYIINMAATTAYPNTTSPYFTPKFDPHWLQQYEEALAEAARARVVEET